MSAAAKEETPPGLDPEKFTAFVGTLVKSRLDAIAARKASGIEDDWIEDEEHYQGIDDANRAFHKSWLTTIKSGVVRSSAQTTDGAVTSTAFLNVTRPVVDTAAAKVADLLLPVDDRCFAIKPTPIATIDPALVTAMQQAGVVDPAAKQADEQAIAERGAAAMQKEIDDHFKECHWNAEVRQVIEDAARLGSGVLKGPFPKQCKVRKFQVVQGVASLEKAETIKPASKWVNLWNFFPDGACGENIHNGTCTWERDHITPKTVQALLKDPTYFRSELEAVLREGPKAINIDSTAKEVVYTTAGQYEIWYYYGQINIKEMHDAGVRLGDMPEDAELETIDAMGVLINDRMVKLTFNVMETGEFPYDVLAWQRRPGMPWGTGVSRHARTPQRMLNAGVRVMLDNGALAGAPQIIISNDVDPVDGRVEIRGRKIWRLKPNSALDVRAAMASFVVDSTQPHLMSMIMFTLQMIEQTTGLPSILQGQEPDKKETLGQAQMRVNNAAGTLRRLAKRFDDFISEPHVTRYYDWFMQFSDKLEIKGDYSVDVRASSALIERDSQKQFMQILMPFAKDPAYGLSPYHLTKEIIISERMDPKKIQVDEKEWKGSQGPSMLDQAKALQLESKTMLDSAQTMFAAINIGKEVALNPAIAGAADATLGSLGFADKNAPPLVGEVAAPMAVSPITENTSPNFPPLPPHADAGARIGIEGGNA